MPTLTMTIDGYIINVSDRIGISQNRSRVTAANIAAQPELAAVGEGGDVNYLHQRLQHLDQGHRLRRHLADRDARRQHDRDAGLQLQQVQGDQVRPGRDQRGAADRCRAPRAKPSRDSVGQLVRGPWTFNARENYYGWWRDEIDYPGQKFGAKFTTDLDLSYTSCGTSRSRSAQTTSSTPVRRRSTIRQPDLRADRSTSDGQVYPTSRRSVRDQRRLLVRVAWRPISRRSRPHRRRRGRAAAAARRRRPVRTAAWSRWSGVPGMAPPPPASAARFRWSEASAQCASRSRGEPLRRGGPFLSARFGLTNGRVWREAGRFSGGIDDPQALSLIGARRARRDARDAASPTPIGAEHGMVVSAHRLASKAGSMC